MQEVPAHVLVNLQAEIHIFEFRVPGFDELTPVVVFPFGLLISGATLDTSPAGSHISQKADQSKV
jgi:hypothetical protein